MYARDWPAPFSHGMHADDVTVEQELAEHGCEGFTRLVRLLQSIIRYTHDADFLQQGLGVSRAAR